MKLPMDGTNKKVTMSVGRHRGRRVELSFIALTKALESNRLRAPLALSSGSFIHPNLAAVLETYLANTKVSPTGALLTQLSGELK